MSDRLRRTWPEGDPLVGVIHLLPLPGSPRGSAPLDEVIERALADARRLEAAGFDGLLVENFGDAPFRPGRADAVTVASMTRVAAEIRRVTEVPLGVNLLRNDALGALAVAAVVGASFIRVNVHTGSMWTDQGLLTGRADRTLRTRSALGVDVAILADVHVKHARPPAGETLAEAAADCFERGLADGLLLTGTRTGGPTSPADIRTVREAVPNAPLWVASGVTVEDAAQVRSLADGAVVGSAVRESGAGTPVVAERAEALARAWRGL